MRLLYRIINKIQRSYWKKSFLSNKNVCFSKILKKQIVVLGKINMIGKPNIIINGKITIYPNVTFMGDGEISFGANVDLGHNSTIYAHHSGGVHIGSNTMIAANCYIIDTDHGIKLNGQLIRDQEYSVKKILIGDNVWIAEGCAVLKGAIIGDGAVCGAKAVIKSAVPENAIAVGVPAKVIKYRND